MLEYKFINFDESEANWKLLDGSIDSIKKSKCV